MAASNEMNPRTELLQGAGNAVNGDRNVSYGDPNDDFKRTAAFWTIYLRGRKILGLDQYISATDVATMMILLKCSRLAWSPTKKDNWMDIAGYAACGWDVNSYVENIQSSLKGDSRPENRLLETLLDGSRKYIRPDGSTYMMPPE